MDRRPEWTASISSIEKLERSDLEVGSKVRIKQPKLPPTVWTVTRIEPGHLMEWQATAAGSKTVA